MPFGTNAVYDDVIGDVDNIRHVADNVSPVGFVFPDVTFGDVIDVRKLPLRDFCLQVFSLEKLDRRVNEVYELTFDDLGISKKEQTVMWFREGVEDGYTHTLEEAGKKFGVTRETKKINTGYL